MAKQTLTGGNGITGQTGQQVRDIINENFTDLYNKAIYVDDYGAVGDGVTDDTAAIVAALAAANNNGVVVFKDKKTYLIKDPLGLRTGQLILGYGATLKRCDAISSTTTAPVANGATAIPVVDGSLFKAGDIIILLDQTSANGGKGALENSGRRVVSTVDGNTVNLVTGVGLPSNGNLNGTGQYATGAILVKHFNMMQRIASNEENIRIEGLTFDGNRANNQLTVWWNANLTIMDLGRNQQIIRCRFKDIPTENITVSHDSIVFGNYAENLGGSFVHIGAFSGANGNNKIINNTIKNACIEPFELSRHNEGAITASNYTVKTLIQGNYLHTCGGALFGGFSAKGGDNIDEDIFIDNNVVYDANGAVYGYSLDAVCNNIRITDNHFENCNYLLLQAYSSTIQITKGFGFNKVTITGNTFIDTRVILESTSNAVVEANNFLHTAAAVRAINVSGIPLVTDYSVSRYANSIALDYCVNVNISNNVFEDKHTTQDANLVSAIAFALERLNPVLIKSALGVNTKYSYGGRNINITGNQIIGFTIGITDAPVFSGVARGNVSYKVFANNNTVELRADALANFGIKGVVGMIVNSNKVYGNTNSVYGIIAEGSDGSNTDINGSIVYDNTVLGIANSIRVGSVDTADAKNNARVINNVITGVVQDNSAGGSTIAGTITIVDETPFIQLVRENPEWY